jgi:hypothetical protein
MAAGHFAVASLIRGRNVESSCSEFFEKRDFAAALGEFSGMVPAGSSGSGVG